MISKKLQEMFGSSLAPASAWVVLWVSTVSYDVPCVSEKYSVKRRNKIVSHEKT